MAGRRGRTAGEEVDDDKGVVVTPAIRVNKARQLFGVMGDEILAQNLQDEEFQGKYSWNREVRQIARKDVPMAKATYDEEEERLQRERLEFLQNQARIAEEDAKLARQYEKEEQLAKERERLRQDVLDQELAKRIQLTEIQETSRPEVRQTRDTGSDGRDAVDGDHPLAGTIIPSSSFAGFHLSSAAGDDGLTEEERKQLMLLQDEELALALHEHEQLKALRSERSQIRARLVADEHTGQSFLFLIPAVQQESLQGSAVSRRPHDSKASQGSVRGDGPSSPPSSQSGRRSPGPPTHQAPRAPVHHVTQTHTTRDANDVKTVTLVTSVGKSEFFRAMPAEPKAPSEGSRTASGTQRESSSQNNRMQTANTNLKVSNKEAAQKFKNNKKKR